MYIPRPLFKEKAIQELKELRETTIIDLLEKIKFLLELRILISTLL